MKILKILAFLLLLAGVLGFYLVKTIPVNLPLNVFGKSYNGDVPLDRLVLPEGFKIDVWASDVGNARSLCYAPQGTVFVGNRSGKEVYALRDSDGDNIAEEKYTIYSGGNMPNGVAVQDGDLYVAEVNRILKWENIEEKLENPGKPEVVFDGYPTDRHHGWKYIAFGPDNMLYVPVGAPCNVCESENEVYNTITRLNPDGSGMEIVQRGVRNTVGFDWHPKTGELYFTDNGRDMMGDEVPECELNRAVKDGQHYGFPYCHQGDVPDPKFGDVWPCSDFVAPIQKLGPHTAPLGMEFYTGLKFPERYQSNIFVARHGSWNRSKKIGYDIVFVALDKQGKSLGYTPFISGWLDEETDDVWGRPVDLEQLPDGSLLISDDYADIIYRVYYDH